MKDVIFGYYYYFLEQLRALYLGDNDFETLPDEIGELRNLQVVMIYYSYNDCFLRRLLFCTATCNTVILNVWYESWHLIGMFFKNST